MSAPVTGSVSESPGNDHLVFERDLATGTNYLVNHDYANDGNAGSAENISMSSDGQFVLFTSDEADLTAGNTNARFNLFEWNLTTGIDTLVSVDFAGTGPGNGDSAYGGSAVMTPDGRYVAFNSTSTNLTATPTENDNVYVRDTVANTTTLVSVNDSGSGEGNSTSRTPSISADGTEVAFVSDASNLTANPKPDEEFGGLDIYVRNLTTSTTTLVSINDLGTGTSNNDSDDPVISANGRYVAFLNWSTDLVSGFVDGNGSGSPDLYLRDLQGGFTKLVTVNLSGTASAAGNEDDSVVQFSGDSSTLIFSSLATDLFAGDRNYKTNIYAVPTAGFSSISGQVFSDTNGNGAIDNGEPGLQYWTVYLASNNSGTLDPGESYVLTDANGDYDFTGLAPGTYTVAIVPETGYHQTAPAATYTVTITTDGTAITGENFGEQLPLPDLTTSAVSFTPTGSANIGLPLTVNWTVTNQGNGIAAGSWTDAVYLSPTPALGAGAVLLATAPHNGGLAAGQAYSGSTTTALPPLPGTYYLIVQADTRNQVFEGALRPTRPAASPTRRPLSWWTWPRSRWDSQFNGQLTAAAPDQYYQFTAPAGQSLVLTLTSAATSGQVELYLTRGSLPTDYNFDFAAQTPATPSRS